MEGTSEEHVAIVRALNAAINRGDAMEFAGQLHPEFQLRELFHVPINPGPHRGPKGAIAWYREGGRGWSEYEVELLSIRPIGERLVAEGEVRATGRASGLATRRRFGYFYEFRDAKLFRLDIYETFAEALAAAEAG